MYISEFLENQIQAAKEERELEFPANIHINFDSRKASIDTRITRNSNRSNNGGDYSFWMAVWENEHGQMLSEERCTCDFWQPQEEPEIWEGVGWKFIVGILSKLSEKHEVPIIFV